METVDRPFFMIYDPVHIFKNIRNNWQGEKTQTINFQDNEGRIKSASWADLIALYKTEEPFDLKNSKLTKASVYPNNVEKQKVSLVNNVFCERTVAALKISSVSNSSFLDTAEFLEQVLQLWKLWSCRSIRERFRHNDTDRVPIAMDAHGERGMAVLKRWADKAVQMRQKGSL